MLTVLVRTVIVYLVAVLAFRFMGKRQVGEMQLSELTTAILMSEFLASPAADPAMPLAFGIIPIAALVALEIVFSLLSMRSKAFNRVFDNRPSVIIERGVINQKELKKLRFGAADLMSALRQKDMCDISKIDCAVLEPNGQLSVFPMGTERTPTRADLGMRGESGMTFTLVCDGSVYDAALSASGHTADEVAAFLSENGLSLDEVFLLNASADGSFSLVKKEAGK